MKYINLFIARYKYPSTTPRGYGESEIMAKNVSGICGKVLTIAITLAMLFSSGFVFTENATAEPIEPVGDSTPPVPPFMIWGIIFDANNEPVPVASVLFTNLRTSESLNANVYENGAYDAELEDMQQGYSIGDEIEIQATAAENIASKIIIVKQIGFGERVDLHFEGSGDSFTDENELAHYNSVQSNNIDSDAILDAPVKSTPEPRTPEDSQTIYIDSPMSTTEEPEPEISLTDIRCPPYFRLAFTEKENNIRITLKNDGTEKRIVIVDLYHVEPDGITESFLRTVHLGAILPGQTKIQDAWEKDDNMWKPSQTDRNWIRGEIYIKDHGNNRILVNTFKESFNIVPGWRPVSYISGDWIVSTPTLIENQTIVVGGSLIVDARLEIRNTDVLAADLPINDEYVIGAGGKHDMECKYDGEYKVSVSSPNGILSIYGKLWNGVSNQSQICNYWFYMNGTLLLTRSPVPTYPPGIIENVMGSPDLSQPGGIICTTDNVRIENGAEVRNGKTHGVWLEGSDAVISGAKIHDNGGNGIVCRAGAKPIIEGCNISWNKMSGIDVENSNPKIQNGNLIQWNRVHGININNVANGIVKIDGNTFDKNFGSGVWCKNVNATITNNTVSSNGLGLIQRENAETESLWLPPSGLWHRSCSLSGEYNLSHEGSWSWWCGDNSTGDYSTGPIYNNFSSRSIDLTKSSSASLTFWSWYETNTQGIEFDMRKVIIQSLSDSFSKTIQLSGDPMKEWSRYIINISEFSGKYIQIHYMFIKDNTDNNYRGWYVDDIEIIASYPGIKGYGIYFEGNNEYVISQNSISFNAWGGIYSNGNTIASIENCKIQKNLNYGIEIANANKINPYGLPKHSPGSALGYYIWQDEYGWHIRWSGDQTSHFFSGVIKFYDNISPADVIPINLDLADNYTVNGNTIDFTAEEDMAEEGFDILLETKLIRIDISVDGMSRKDLIHIGILSRTPNVLPYEVQAPIIVKNCIIANSLVGVSCCQNTFINSNVITNCSFGISSTQDLYSNAAFISYNVINNCSLAIFNPRKEVIIDGNKINNCRYAVFAARTGCTFKNNNVTNISKMGIYIDNAYKCDIENNTFINNNEAGIYFMDDCGPWIIKNNTLMNITGLGISVHDAYDMNSYTDISYNYLNNIGTMGISVYLNMRGRITNNTIINPREDGIMLCDNYSPLLVENNIITSLNHACSTGIREYLSDYTINIRNNQISGFKIGIKSTTSGVNTIIENNSISGNTNGIYCDQSSPMIINSTISLSGQQDLNLTMNSHPTVLNTTFNKTKVQFIDALSTLTVQWFLDVKVVYENSVPVSGASVTVKDNLGNEIANCTTATNGLIRWIHATEYVQNQATSNWSTPHNITAMDGSLVGWAAPEPLIDHSQEVIVILGIGQGYLIPLQQGWNMISFPFEPFDMSSNNILNVLKSINGKWEVVKYYDTTDIMDPWKTYRPTLPPELNDLNHLDQTMGFWIYITNPGVTLLAFGNLPTTTNINLYAGWNLVGYPTFCDNKTVGDAFWGTGADRVEVFDAASPSFTIVVGPTYLMKSGEGYWVHVPADRVWTVDW
jgi:parallel beta-helix repeat protein